MAWIWLAIAGLLEIGWAIGLKYNEGWTRVWPSLAAVVCAVTSFILLARSLRSLPVGTAYPVWVGIGAVGVFFAGVIFFGESASVPRLALVALILTGVVGLKLVPR